MRRKGISSAGLVILLCWLGYSAATFGRINLTANVVNFTSVGYVTKSRFAYVGVAFAVTYGIGQLVNGILCERLNSKMVLSTALMLSGATSIAVGLLKSTVAIALLWGVNGAVQSMLWPHTVKLISSLDDGKSVGKGLMAIGTTSSVGTVLAYGVSALATFFGCWRASFFASGAALVLSGALVLLLLPAINVQKTKKAPISQNKSNFVAFLPCLIPIFICAILLNYVNHGLTTWMPNLLNEYYDMPEYFSILVTMIIPVVGILCGIASVKVSERVNSSLITAIMFSGVAIVGIAISVLFMSVSALPLIIGFAIGTFGAHADNSVFTAVFPSEMRGYLGSGMLAGIIDAFCYVGTALSSLVPAVLIERSGYQSFLVSAIIVGLIFAVVCLFASAMLTRCKRGGKR